MRDCGKAEEIIRENERRGCHKATAPSKTHIRLVLSGNRMGEPLVCSPAPIEDVYRQKDRNLNYAKPIINRKSRALH